MKKNNLVLTLCLTVCISVFSFSTCAQSAVSQINMAASFTMGDPVMRKVLTPWADEMRRRTGGRVNVRFYNPGVLAQEREYMKAVLSGELGAGHGLISSSQGRLIISGIMDMPSEMTNSLAATEAFWRLFSSSPEMQAEFSGIKVLALHASAPYQLNVAKGNVYGAQDFKNQKLLTPPGGDSARFLRALGLNPLMTPAQDFALSLSRSMADGCIMPMSAVRAFTLEDKLASISVCNLRMDAYWIGMNMDLYNSLPPDSQRVLNELSGLELSMAIARVINEQDNLARAELSQGETVLNEIAAEERTRWLAQGLPAVRDNWTAQLKRRGVDNGLEIWTRAREIFQDAQAKWGNRASQQVSAPGQTVKPARPDAGASVSDFPA